MFLTSTQPPLPYCSLYLISSFLIPAPHLLLLFSSSSRTPYALLSFPSPFLPILLRNFPLLQPTLPLHTYPEPLTPSFAFHFSSHFFFSMLLTSTQTPTPPQHSLYLISSSLLPTPHLLSIVFLFLTTRSDALLSFPSPFHPIFLHNFPLPHPTPPLQIYTQPITPSFAFYFSSRACLPHALYLILASPLPYSFLYLISSFLPPASHLLPVVFLFLTHFI